MNNIITFKKQNNLKLFFVSSYLSSMPHEKLRDYRSAFIFHLHFQCFYGDKNRLPEIKKKVVSTIQSKNILFIFKKNGSCKIWIIFFSMFYLATDT